MAQKPVAVMSVRVPPEMHKKLGHLSVDYEISMNAMIVEAIQAYLDREYRRT